MSSFQSIVDKDGNINSKLLTKELKEALESDVKYKQTDNMKKRAVKVAADYSEFKNMVASAHLKKLTKQEVESLSHVKKGWQKSIMKDNSSSAQLLNKEIEMDQINHNSLVKIINENFKKPKTSMEFDRDLRRYLAYEDKKIYLSNVGFKRVKSLLSIGGDTDVIEQVLIIITYNKNELLRANTNNNTNSYTTNNTNNNNEDVHTINDDITISITTQLNEINNNNTANNSIILNDIKWRRKWLSTLIEFDKFDLMIRFASNQIINDAIDILQLSLACNKLIENEDNNHSTIIVIERYKKGLK